MEITITKKQWTIIGVVIAVIAIWYFFLRKKKTESGYGISGANIGAEHCCDPHCNTRSVGGKCLGVTAKAGTAGVNVRRSGVNAIVPCTSNSHCGANMQCERGRCVFTSGSHW